MSYFFIGSFNSAITLWKWDPVSLKFAFIEIVADDGLTTAPSWISVSPDRHFIFSTNEEVEGSISSYRLVHMVNDAGEKIPRLQFIHRFSSLGGWPCHLHVENSFLISSNYKTGTVGLFSISSEGECSVNQMINHNELSLHQAAVWIY